MSSRNRLSPTLVICTLGIGLFFAARSMAADPFIGEITGNRVNVRSGPSTNYYIVTTLNAGDRVDVRSEDNGWYAIVPPQGCYSVISKTYVDIDAMGKGVVNGDAVHVRAGSDSQSRPYAVQLKLNKGAEVEVIGEAPDDFLKIAPPTGANLWVRSDYVVRVPPGQMANEAQQAEAWRTKATGEEAAADAGEVEDHTAEPADDRATEPEAETSDAEPSAVEPIDESAPASIKGDVERRASVPVAVDARSLDPVAASVRSAPVVTVESIDSSEHREQLHAADARIEAEMAKPLHERHFNGIVDEFRAIASQDVDKIARLYAERRIAQLEAADSMAAAVREIHDLSTGVAQVRKDARTDRSGLRRQTVPIDRGFDAIGELRESMIFTSAVGPRRYRLIDPDMAVPRTLCYVEIPSGLPVEIIKYLGRRVGVRARRQYVETGNVSAIPVLEADELVLLDEPADDEPAPAKDKTANGGADGADGAAAVATVDSADDGR